MKAQSGWSEPLRWFRAALGGGVRRRVFCASLGDVFEDRRDLDGPRQSLCGLIEATEGSAAGLDWLLLTKRPENILRLIPERWRAILPPNVWVGASVEDQEAADARIPHLVRVPARVLFLSLEPLLGPVNLRRWLTGCAGCPECGTVGCGAICLDWLILGGESGPHARPCDLAWIRDLRDQGRAAGVPVFVKQLGAHAITTTPERGRNMVERFDEVGRIVGQGLRVLTVHPKGADPTEWPEDLCMREFPERESRAFHPLWRSL